MCIQYSRICVMILCILINRIPLLTRLKLVNLYFMIPHHTYFGIKEVCQKPTFHFWLARKVVSLNYSVRNFCQIVLHRAPLPRRFESGINWQKNPARQKVLGAENVQINSVVFFMVLPPKIVFLRSSSPRGAESVSFITAMRDCKDRHVSPTRRRDNRGLPCMTSASAVVQTVCNEMLPLKLAQNNMKMDLILN